jgi:hypothetical protein
VSGSEWNWSLTDRQLQVIPHLLAAASIKEASRTAKISKTIIYRWLKEARFRDELSMRQNDVYQSAVDRLKTGVNKAVEKLLTLLDSPTEETSRRAANDILTHALRALLMQAGEASSARTPFTVENVRAVWEMRKATAAKAA